MRKEPIALRLWQRIQDVILLGVEGLRHLLRVLRRCVTVV